MTALANPKGPGLLRRIWSALQRGILGKSSRAHTKTLGGSEEYWDRAIAAQLRQHLNRVQGPGH